jgi:hypothetical protein
MPTIIEKIIINIVANIIGENIQNQPHVITLHNFKIKNINVNIVGNGKLEEMCAFVIINSFIFIYIQ